MVRFGEVNSVPFFFLGCSSEILNQKIKLREFPFSLRLQKMFPQKAVCVFLLDDLVDQLPSHLCFLSVSPIIACVEKIRKHLDDSERNTKNKAHAVFEKQMYRLIFHGMTHLPTKSTLIDAPRSNADVWNLTAKLDK